MRTITETKDVYTYDELSDDAKTRVREWWNSGNWEDGIAQEDMQMIADGILEDAGFSEAKNLEYSLYSQGGYPTFETSGYFEYDKHTYEMTVSGRYREIDLQDTNGIDGDYSVPDSAYVAAKEFLSTLSNKMFWVFREEDEYQSSDENVSELCEANGYEFDVNGVLI